MAEETYRLTVEAEDQATAGRSATALADVLREAEGVVEAVRTKAANSTMDLGVIVSVLASSGATLAIAEGLAAWLRARRGVTITVERDAKAGSLRAAVAGLDPASALRIVEMVRDG
jgi:hypothetical protein